MKLSKGICLKYSRMLKFILDNKLQIQNFKISTTIGKKALDASENCFRDQIVPPYRGIAAINYGLILSIQLILNGVETIVYFDSPKMTNPASHLSDEDQSPHAKLFATLNVNFSEIKFIPSTKGRFIERLRTKLEDLSAGSSNEIVQGYMPEILKNVKIYP